MELMDFVLESPYEDEIWGEMGADALPAFDEVLSAQDALAQFEPDSTAYAEAKALLLLETQSIPVEG